MRYLMIAIAFCTMTNGAVGQNFGSTNSEFLRDNVDPSAMNTELRTGKSYAEIKGIAYYVDAWNVGTITSSSGKILEKVILKLDLYQQAVLVKHEGEESILSTESINDLTMLDAGTGAKIKFVRMKAPDGLKEGFYRELYQGKHGVYEYQTKKIVQSGSTAGSYGADESTKFVDSKAFYIKIGEDGPVKEITNKNEFLEIFPNHESKLKSYIKSEKLKFKQEEDLIKLAKYLDTL